MRKAGLGEHKAGHETTGGGARRCQRDNESVKRGLRRLGAGLGGGGGRTKETEAGLKGLGEELKGLRDGTASPGAELNATCQACVVKLSRGGAGW